jgi:WD40 repeat protein
VTLPGEGRLAAVGFSPDGKYCAAGWTLWDKWDEHDEDHRFLSGSQLDVWELSDGPRLLWRRRLKQPCKVTKTGNGGYSRVALEIPFEDLAAFVNFDPRWLTDIYASNLNSKIKEIVFDPSGREILMRSEYACVRWKVEDGEVQDLVTNKYHSAAFEPDGGLLVGTGGGQILRRPPPGVLEPGSASSPRQDDRFLLHEGAYGPVTALAISPDGTQLASGGEDRTIRLYERGEHGRLVLDWPAHASTVTALTFSADGTILVSGSQDGQLRLWDLAALKRGLQDLGLEW